MSHTTSRRNFLRFAAVGIGTTAGAAVLAACSNNTKDSSTTTSSSSGAASSSAESTDRVVALNTGQLDNLLMLGILPVGAAKAKGGQTIPPYIEKEFGSAYDLKSIADCGVRANPDLEVIASLRPTLICANSRTETAILDQLKAVAPVVTGEGGGENWKQDLLTIAEAVGKKDEAQTKLKDYEQAAADLGTSLHDVPTVSFLRTKDDQFQLYGVNSMAGSVAKDAGLKRPENQQNIEKAGRDLSAEQLGEADADWLFYGVKDGAADPTKASTWPSLEAVKKSQAVEVDYESWYMNASLLSATLILDGLKEHLA